MKHTFTQKDKLTLEECGISESDAQEQLYLLQNGANYAHLERPATQDDGITVLTEKETAKYALLFDNEKSNFSKLSSLVNLPLPLPI
mgnify:CR=1 FL=1